MKYIYLLRGMIAFKPETHLIEFLKNYCNKIETPSGSWYYCPFWFKENKELPELVSAFNFENVPSELLDEIKKRRDGKSL
jgi:Zn-finger protein